MYVYIYICMYVYVYMYIYVYRGFLPHLASFWLILPRRVSSMFVPKALEMTKGMACHTGIRPFGLIKTS